MQIRKDVKKYQVELDRNKVKVLMSKFEIQQNNKLENELEKINDLVIKETRLWII
ncbi:MAG: hypothetical protein LBC61_02700 [Candidatus Peribacteria bacterium]|jgi:hypothetical protein|nr:hypothetical protein [Candidatus Peribacteria bacterium]